MTNSFRNDKYRPLAILAYPLMALFGCLLIMSVFLAILGFSYALFHRDLYSPQESGVFAFIFALMTLFVNFEIYFRIATIILFLGWVYRAYKNLASLRVRGLEHTPAWAVGLWFIPFVNLVKPFQVMREIWHGSDPEIEDNTKVNRVRAGTPEIMGFWWGLFLVSGVAIYVANIMAGNERIPENTYYPAALVLSELLRASAILLILLIVREITRMQDARFQRLTGVSRYSDELPPQPPSFSGTGNRNEGRTETDL